MKREPELIFVFALFLFLAGVAYYIGYRDGVSRSGWNYHEGFSDGMRLGPLEAERKARVHLKESK